MVNQPGIVEYTSQNYIEKPSGTAIRLFVDSSDNKLYYKTKTGLVLPVVETIPGMVKLIGNWDSSSGLFPSAPFTIKSGYEWVVSVSGVLDGEAVDPGDLIIAKIDNPGQVASNWVIIENNIGYVPENIENKATDFSTVNNIKYPTVKAVSDYISNLGISKFTISEELFNSDISSSSSAVIPFTPLYSKSYDVDSNVVDGKTRRLRFVLNYSKTIGSSTINFRLGVGSNNLDFAATSMGTGAIINNGLVFDLFLNFMPSNKVNIYSQYERRSSTGLLNSQRAFLNNVNWDKTILNNIVFNWAIITGSATHSISITSVTSELL